MKIDIIGRGNVASHLRLALQGKRDVNMVNPHSLEGLRQDAGLFVISVTDSAIREVAGRLSELLKNNTAPIVHTSGTTGIDALGCVSGPVGVFYPLQTFSKDVPLDYEEIPFFIEASDNATLQLLRETAGLVSHSVYEADSEQRRSLHVASVMSCNFVNHLFALSKKYLESRGLPFEALKPLIGETVRKALANDPANVQTGPAARRDGATIRRHLEMLEDDENLKKIYETLTLSIIDL